VELGAGRPAAAIASAPAGASTGLAQGLSVEQNLADLQLIADSLTALAGFDVAAIRVARPDGLHLAVVSGSEEARRVLSGTPLPLGALEEDLARADDWGLFKFVPAERVGEGTAVGWVPDVEPGDGDDAWRSLDLLVAPLRDSDGTLRGTLDVDLPTDGRRPGPERRAVLTRYAAQAERAILLALEREGLAHRVRLAEAARDVIRRAAREVEPERVLDSVGTGLVDVLDLAGLWIHITQPDGGVRTRVHHQAAGRPLTEEQSIYAVYREHGQALWRRQQVALASVDGTFRHVGGSPEERAALIDYLAAYGLASVATVPLGAEEVSYGALVLGRAPGAAPWSDDELATLLDLGRDLGRVIHTSRTHQRQHEALRALQELDSHKSRLIATVAHEVRNPLTAIRWNLESLPHAFGEEEYADLLDVVERNRDRARAIVTDLAVLSAVTDPDQFPTAGPVAVAPVVSAAVDLVRDQHRGADGGTLEMTLELPDEPVAVLLAPGELDRIALNLLGNAVKYSPEGGRITLTVRARVDDIELTVSDEGLGISSADQQHLFDEFFRSTDPLALALPGSGLGLAIIDRIVRRRGGRVTVDSTPGEGSTFRVTLPRAAIDG